MHTDVWEVRTDSDIWEVRTSLWEVCTDIQEGRSEEVCTINARSAKWTFRAIIFKKFAVLCKNCAAIFKKSTESLQGHRNITSYSQQFLRRNIRRQKLPISYQKGKMSWWVRLYLTYFWYYHGVIVFVNRERFMFVQNNLAPDLIWSIFVW